MSMTEMNYYKFCMEEPLPSWVKSERYEYCDFFDPRMLRAKPIEQKKSFFHSLMTTMTSLVH